MTNPSNSSDQISQIPPKPPYIIHQIGEHNNPLKPTPTFKYMLLVNSEETHITMQHEEPHTQPMPVDTLMDKIVQSQPHTRGMEAINKSLQINLFIDDLQRI